MGAASVSHGVISIEIKPSRELPSTSLQNEASPATVNRAASTGPAPEPVVVHKTSAQIEAEAQAVSDAAAQLKADAEAAAQPAA